MCKHLGWIVAVSISFHTFLAADSTWSGPGNLFNSAANWTPAAVPGPADLAIFAGANPLDPTIPSGINESVLGVQFMGSAAYTLTNDGTLTIGTSGINNQSSVQQTILTVGTPTLSTVVVNSGNFSGPLLFQTTNTPGNDVDVVFTGTTSTGSATFDLTDSTPVVFQTSVAYIDTATAPSNTFNVQGASRVSFIDSSTAGNSVFNLSNEGMFTSPGLGFSGTSSAQNAVINANDSFVRFFNAGVGGAAAMTLTNMGRLQVDADNTLGSLAVDASSTVILNANLQVGSLGTSTTIAGTMTAGGSFTKVGAGTITFSTNGKAYTGPTTVDGGTLLLNTSIAGDAIVNSGATLAGNGTVGGNATINSGGIISPGNNNIATLTVNGNYTQNTGSFYFDEIAGTNQSDLINVGGAATLNGGTVRVISGSPVLGGSYKILHANGGVTGTFSSLALNSPFRAILVYQPMDVFIDVIGTNFAPFARTPNQRHTAKQFDSLTTFTPDEQLVANALGQLSVPQFQHALDLMSGEQYANLLPIEQQVTRRFIRRLYDPLRELLTGCLCCTPCRCGEYGIEPWLQVEGGRSFLRRDFNGRGFKDDFYSISYGAQTVLEMLDGCWVLGVAGDYSHDRIKHNLSGHSKLRTSEAALYGAFFRPDFYVLADLIGGRSSCHSKRHIQFGSINRRTRAHPDLWNVVGYGEFGCNFCTHHVLVQPFVAFENGYYSRKRVREHGANSLDLIIKKETVTSFDSRMGFHFTSCFCDRYIVSADVAWQHRFNSLGDDLRNRFVDFGDTFTIRGPRQGCDGIDAAIYLGAQVKEWLTLFAEFSGEKWDRYSTWGALGGIEARF